MLGIASADPAVEEPTYRVGDSFTFGNPAITWRVVAIDDDRVTWRSDQGDEQLTARNPLLPALGWKSERLGSGRRIISDQVGNLFPMKVGARTTFKAVVTTDKPPYGWSFDWQCEVVDRQEVVGPAGMLDAFKVGCGRGSLDEIVFFYAPTIGHYIAKTSRSEGEVAVRVRHLVAYEKMTLTGALERVEFARVPSIGEPAAARIVERPTQEVAAQKVNDVEIAAATPVAGGRGIEETARRLLDRRTEVGAEATQPRTVHAAVPKAVDTVPEKLKETMASPENAVVANEAIAAAGKTSGYRLVEARLPSFPPRPKLNPERQDGVSDAVVAEGAANAPALPVASLRSVTDVPVIETKRSSNPFDVSIIGKAHANADKTTEIVVRAREKALRTPGMADEAMLAVQSVRSAARPPGPPPGAKVAAMPDSRGVSRGSDSSSQVALEADLTPEPSRRQVAARTEPSATDASAAPQKFYGVHLGTFLDPRRALLGWQHIFRTHEDLLAGLQPRIRRHELGDEGVRYRLRVVPFVDETTAQRLCDKLSERGKYCRVYIE